MPPRSVRPGLVSPPKTAAAKPLNANGRSDENDNATDGEINAPARPPSAPPTANAMKPIWRTLMPTRAAARGLDAHAVRPLPTYVRLKNNDRATKVTSVAATTSRRWRCTSAPRIDTEPLSPGGEIGSWPHAVMKIAAQKIDTPRVTMSAISGSVPGLP